MFTGDSRLHAIQDAGLWKLEYKRSNGTGAGELPEALKQRFTNFNQLMKYVTAYFASRILQWKRSLHDYKVNRARSITTVLIKLQFLLYRITS